MATKPEFDDPLPGEKPAAMLRDDHLATFVDEEASRRAEDHREAITAASDAERAENRRAATVPSTPKSDPLTDALEGVADGDSARAARALFDPTLKRMAILLDTLINMTGNGDFALWLPLNLMDATLRSFDWQKNPKAASLKLLALVSQALTHYAGKIDAHRLEFEKLADGAPPTLPVFTQADMLEMYDIVDVLYGEKP